MDVPVSECGYFGKLPDRADYVTGPCPPGFLTLWERFLTAGMASARAALLERWQEAYMTMPVWRFRLTPSGQTSELKQPVVGGFMPSVDRVGRQFPLSVFAVPGSDRQSGDRRAGDWFDGAEEILLRALEEDVHLEDFRAGVARLQAPSREDADAGKEPFVDLQGEQDCGGKVSAEFWCRAGSESYRFRSTGMPAPDAFRWLVLPECHDTKSGLAAADDGAGNQTGQYHPEDHQT